MEFKISNPAARMQRIPAMARVIAIPDTRMEGVAISRTTRSHGILYR